MDVPRSENNGGDVVLRTENTGIAVIIHDRFSSFFSGDMAIAV